MHQELKKAVQSYVAPKATFNYLKKVPLVVIAGLSGAGKNTIIKELLKTNKFQYIITYTTRKPRSNNGIKEQNGREYFFISEAKALSMLRDKVFIEATITHERLYGTTLWQFQEAYQESLIPITDIDVKGADLYYQKGAVLKAFFIAPPNLATQIDRIKTRYSNEIDVVDYKNRILTSILELEVIQKEDYFIPVINDDQNKTKDIILTYLFQKNRTLNDTKALDVINKLLVELKTYAKTL